jgi:hypothetical protein
MIVINSETLEADNTMNSDLFKNFASPLLESIVLKDPQGVPEEYEFFNISKEDYNQVYDYIKNN